jgi:hypothetical protein
MRDIGCTAERGGGLEIEAERTQGLEQEGDSDGVEGVLGQGEHCRLDGCHP